MLTPMRERRQRGVQDAPRAASTTAAIPTGFSERSADILAADRTCKVLRIDSTDDPIEVLQAPSRVIAADRGPVPLHALGGAPDPFNCDATFRSTDPDAPDGTRRETDPSDAAPSHTPHMHPVRGQADQEEQEHEARPKRRVLDPVALRMEEDPRAGSCSKRKGDEELTR